MMKAIRVDKQELLDTLIQNRDQHRTVFEKALEIYRERFLEELENRIVEVKAGQAIRRAFSLPEPEDHTEDYNRVIQMLERSVDDIIELPEQDFAQYVLNEWGWQRSFAMNTGSYLVEEQ